MALIVLIVLYVGSQLASTLIATATADANQRRLMLLLPVVFVVILYRYPAGLLVYWITTNLWTIGQQYLIKKRMGPPVTPTSQPPPDGEREAERPSAAHTGPGRGRGGRGRRRPADAVDTGRGATTPAAQEEETIGEAQVSEVEQDQELAPAEALEELLEEIVEDLQLEADVEVEESDGVLTGRLEGENVGLFIGRHGQTIDAVQHLAQRIVFPEGPSSVRVVIDANGYRERRAETLRADADDAADEAVASGQPVELDPLPPSERRIVHEYLRDREDVETHSEGDEPERYLVISPQTDPGA